MLCCCLLPINDGYSDEARSVGNPSKPNIVLILADDLGWGAAGFHSDFAETPNLDRFVASGIELDRFYVAPMCTPTRAGLLTGRYPIRFGLARAVIPPYRNFGLPIQERTLPEVLATAGYRRRGIFGKWHLGYEPQFHPRHYGFDRFFGVLGGNCHYFTHRELSDIPVLYRDDNPVEEKGYMTHLITKEALSFLDEHEANPFFLYVPYTTPHFPFQRPEDAEKNFTSDNWSKGTRESYVGMLEDMDRSVGQIC